MKMRNIYTLIEAIKKEIPKEKRAFLLDLDDVIDSANYRAPEAYLVNFDQLSIVFGRHLPEPEKLTNEWQKKIVGMFTDEIKIDGMDFIDI